MKPVVQSPRFFSGRIFRMSVILLLTVFSIVPAIAQTIESAGEPFTVPALNSDYSFIRLAKSGNGTAVVMPPEAVQKFGDTLPAPFSPPPANDDCAAGLGATYTLFPGAACTNGSLNGAGGSPAATVQAGETFGCMAGPPVRSVWYNFTATSANMWVSIESTGALVCNQNFGLRVYNYSGVCPPASASEVGCKAYTTYSAQNVFNLLNLSGLVVGNTYLIQVGQNPACGRYPFCIRIGVPTTCTSCGNLCGPMCQFAGPAAPTPVQITSSCTGYPLSPPMNQNDIQTNCFSFTAPNDSISLQMIVQSYCGGGMYFFNYTLYNTSCGVIQTGSIFTNNGVIGLTPGTNYRICYSFQTACSTVGQIYPYVYTTSTVLPVELLYFDAYSANDEIELFWSTASEINSDEFIVERTRDGKEFEEVTRIKAAGNSITTLNYKAIDRNPYAGLSYYRLRQVDFDGKTYDSKLVVAKHISSVTDVQLFPNPSKENAFVKLVSEFATSGTLQVINSLGALVYDEPVSVQSGINFIPVSLSELPAGIYSVHLMLGGQRTALKLIRE
jgi:hypothetical protein